MNKKLKENVKTAFYAPAPKHKTEFLLSLNYPKSTRFQFLIAQAGYIRKIVWGVMFVAILPLLILLFSNITENMIDYIWVASSVLPFIVLTGMTEIARSISYNMAELEISCKYSFSDVVIARLIILGCTNMIVFAVVISLFRMVGSVDVLRLVTYLFIPFLLTCALSLFAFNRLRSKESVYICGVISCFVSIINALLSNQYRIAFSNEYVVFWVIAFCILLVWTVGEVIRLVKRTEEYQWNSLLTA